jgi:hypothetical protein
MRRRLPALLASALTLVLALLLGGGTARAEINEHALKFATQNAKGHRPSRGHGEVRRTREGGGEEQGQDHDQALPRRRLLFASDRRTPLRGASSEPKTRLSEQRRSKTTGTWE